MPAKRRTFDLRLVFAAFAISFVIWMMAEQGALETDRLIVPIDLLNVPDNVEMRVDPLRLPIIVKFPQTQRRLVVAQNFDIRFDIEEIFGTEQSEWIDSSEPLDRAQDVTLDNVVSIDLPQSIQVTDIGAGSVRLTATLLTKDLTVIVPVTGSLPSRFELAGEIRAEPPMVTVTASREALNALSDYGDVISTEPVNLEGRVQSDILFLGLELPDQVKPVGEPNVQVVLTIEEKSVDHAIGDIPIELYVLDAQLKANATPPVAEVVIHGKLSATEQIAPDAFRFSSLEQLIEKPGAAGRIDLVVDFGDEVSRELREQLEIISFEPTSVVVEFVARVQADTPEPTE